MTCYSNPGQDGIPPTPDQHLQIRDYSWDAGAESAQIIDGGLHLVFNMGNQNLIGAVVGLKHSAGGLGAPPLVDYGFSFQRTNANGNCWFIVERGIAKTAPVARAVGFDETFEVRRSMGVVHYLVKPAGGAAQIVYTSSTRSLGEMRTSACLFASGDTVG